MAVTGFYQVEREPAKAASAQPTTRRENARDLIARIGAESGRDDHPAPFKFTRVSPQEERQIAIDDLRRLRELAGRSIVNRPALWTDGPLDFALTVIAMLNEDTRNTKMQLRRAIPSTNGHVALEATRDAWVRAQERVRELPRELLVKTAARPTRTYDHRTTRQDHIGTNQEGMLEKAVAGKIRHNLSMLVPPFRQPVAETPGIVDEALTPLRERINVLTPIQAMIGNTDDYPTAVNIPWGRAAGRGNPQGFARLRERAGDERADLVAVMNSLLQQLVTAARVRNRSAPMNLNDVFNMNNGEWLSRYMFRQRLIRQTSMTDNWTDPDYELMLRMAFGVTAHMSMSTLDVLCHAPSTVNLNASALTVKTLAEVDKPTVRWDDGSKFYIYDGVELNPNVIRAAVDKPSTLLQVGNVEQRRVLLRLVGTDALLADVSAKLVNKDDFGELYVLPNKTQFVIVQNATAEPDNTFRKYVLGAIGNAHKTARSAIASTWGLREDQYYPTKET